MGAVEVSVHDFGCTAGASRRSVELYCFRSPGGLAVDVATWGATVVSVRTPDRDGVVEEVTLNHSELPGILQQEAYYGATIGRVASTIAGARYKLGDREYTLSANVNDMHHAHGGVQGFDKQVLLRVHRCRAVQGLLGERWFAGLGSRGGSAAG